MSWGPTTRKGRRHPKKRLRIVRQRGKRPQATQMMPASKTKSRLLKNRRTAPISKMPLHPKFIQIRRRRPKLCKNRMKIGSFESPKKDRKSYGIQKVQICVIRSSDPTNIYTIGWEGKLETANLEKHAEFLRERQFVLTPHPVEATAWENGYVPETRGLPSESGILPLLPQLSHMVSAPRQPIAAGISLLTRFDANIRPYCETGSLVLVDIPRCMSIKLMGRLSGSIR